MLNISLMESSFSPGHVTLIVVAVYSSKFSHNLILSPFSQFICCLLSTELSASFYVDPLFNERPNL